MLVRIQPSRQTVKKRNRIVFLDDDLCAEQYTSAANAEAAGLEVQAGRSNFKIITHRCSVCKYFHMEVIKQL
jgi:hypothetical protein